MIIGVQMGVTSGVAVYENGDVIYAASEERFSREKNDATFPTQALENAIKVCHITPDKIEKVVIPSQNMMPYQFLCDLGTYSIEDYIKEQNDYWKPRLLENGGVIDYLDIFRDKLEMSENSDLLELLKQVKEDERIDVFKKWRITKLSRELKIPESKIEIINHEYAHASYGLYGSEYRNKNDVLTIVYDGYGDYSNASVYSYNGRLKQEAKYTKFNIGRVYRYVTLILGMKPNEHEYKVMGLAPYCTEYIYKKPLNIFRNAYQFIDGQVVIDSNLHDNYFYFKEKLDGMRFDGIAAGLQIHTEEMCVQLAEYWTKKLQKTKLAISGGVSLNIKTNMEIGKCDSVEELFVTGSGGDESLCIGAIFEWLDENGRGDEIKGLPSLYLGDETDDQKSVIEKSKVHHGFEVTENASPSYMAQKIADGYIIGRIDGRMEFGARALGNRSILADPRKRQTVDKINKKIKSRDFWMPFTPSILKEDEDMYLDNPKQFSFPYMSIACETTDFARNNIPAAIHPADFTARPQLVSETSNKKYHDLIKAFKDITGIGVLLNTSLNVHGYPIVRTCEEAYKVLVTTDLDGLIVGNTLILKKTEGQNILK